MYPMEKALLNLLKGYIFLDNTTIPIIRRLKPIDKTPCITIQQAAEVQLSRRYLNKNDSQLIGLKNNAEIWINIWCDTEEERHSLINQVTKRIFQALGNHYTTCANYDKDDSICSTLNHECQSLTVTNGRSVKGQCPYPKKYNYCNWFHHHHIVKNSFKISGRNDMDELDIAEPVLRTLIQLDMDYYLTHDLGGITFYEIQLNEDLL